MLVAQGKLAEALQAYEAARTIAQRLAQQDPGHAGWQSDLSTSHNKVGYVLEQQGKLAEGLPAYEASHAIAQRLAQQQCQLAE